MESDKRDEEETGRSSSDQDDESLVMVAPPKPKWTAHGKTIPNSPQAAQNKKKDYDTVPCRMHTAGAFADKIVEEQSLLRMLVNSNKRVGLRLHEEEP